MTDYFYTIIDTQNGFVYFSQGLPFYSQDLALAQFVAWSLNQYDTNKPNRYKVKKFLGVPEPESKLNVPFWSQWGRGADLRCGDCGPACIAMLAAHLTPHSPSVDEAAAACGQPASGEGAKYTNHAQLRQGAKAYGFTLESRSKYSPPALTLDLLKEQIGKGLPSIALIHYGVLRDKTNPISGIIHNQDQKYDRGHWILFIGYDQKGIYIHDPDFWTDRTYDGKARFIPTEAFKAALDATAPGCSVGNQGLIVKGTPK